jgi:YaiO family outer membrane protein
MKRNILVCLSLVIVLSVIGFSADWINSKDKALQALRSKDYSLAIEICLEQLASTPDDYEFNFILSYAYAFSNQWEKAIDVLDKMIALYPDNSDVLLFWARVQSWMKNSEAAESGYNRILTSNPDNVEAMIGLAEVASRTKDYPKAIDIYEKILHSSQDNPDIHFRLGRVYLWDGNYNKAREHMEEAVRLDPENTEYQQVLTNSRPQFTDNFEIRYQHRIESFSDQRDNYIDQEFVFQFSVPKNMGTLLLKYNQTSRFDEQDHQYGMEFYPHLWNGAYGYLNLNYSSEALLYPQISFLAEVYQTFLSSAEFSLGYRRMNFRTNPISIYLGSLGYYLGRFYTYFRWYYSLEDKVNTFSWTINIRRYFSKDNYVSLGYGQGSRPFDVSTIDDFLITQSRIFQAGFIWYFFKGIRLEFHFSHTDEKASPDRNTFYACTGYRW